MSRLPLMVTLKSGSLANGLPDTFLLMLRASLAIKGKIRPDDVGEQCKGSLSGASKYPIRAMSESLFSRSISMKLSSISTVWPRGGGAAVDARRRAIRREAGTAIGSVAGQLDESVSETGARWCAHPREMLSPSHPAKGKRRHCETPTVRAPLPLPAMLMSSLNRNTRSARRMVPLGNWDLVQIDGMS